MYVTVKWRRGGIPTERDIIDAAAAGWSSRKDQNCLEIFENSSYGDSVAFLKRLIGWNHTSVLEHIIFKFHINLSVACAAQHKAHRWASYTQKSFRIARNFSVSRDINSLYIIPPQITKEDLEEWISDSLNHIIAYNKWLKKGYSLDVARFHLHQGLATNLAVTINARSLRNVFSMRLDKHAMFEFIDLCKQMIELIKENNLYFLFKDIVEGADIE